MMTGGAGFSRDAMNRSRQNRKLFNDFQDRLRPDKEASIRSKNVLTFKPADEATTKAIDRKIKRAKVKDNLAILLAVLVPIILVLLIFFAS